LKVRLKMAFRSKYDPVTQTQEARFEIPDDAVVVGGGFEGFGSAYTYVVYAERSKF